MAKYMQEPPAVQQDVVGVQEALGLVGSPAFFLVSKLSILCCLGLRSVNLAKVESSRNKSIPSHLILGIANKENLESKTHRL